MTATFTLHGASIATCTRRVLVCAAEIGVDVPLESIAEMSEMKTPEWLKKQPFGQIPYLESNDGFVLFESRAIAKYLAIKNNSPLVPSPSDAEAYALFEQACSIEQANFDPSASALAFEMVFKKMHGRGEADPARVEQLKTALASKLDGYERILSKHAYIAGDKLTLADLFHLPYGKMASDLGVAPGLTDGSLPHVTKWWAAITALPSWKALNGEADK